MTPSQSGDVAFKLGIAAAGLGWGLSATWPATGVEYAVIGVAMGIAGVALMVFYDPSVPEVGIDAT